MRFLDFSHTMSPSKASASNPIAVAWGGMGGGGRRYGPLTVMTRSASVSTPSRGQWTYFRNSCGCALPGTTINFEKLPERVGLRYMTYLLSLGPELSKFHMRLSPM